MQPYLGFQWCLRPWKTGALASETVFAHMERSEICHVRFLKNALSLALDLKRDFQGCALPKQDSKRGCKSCVLACWWSMVNKEQGLGRREDEQVPGAHVCVRELTGVFNAAKALHLYDIHCWTVPGTQGSSGLINQQKSPEKGKIRRSWGRWASFSLH